RSLMRHIGCLDTLTKGIVSLKWNDISSLDESKLTQIRGKTIGFTFQQFNLIHTRNSLENGMRPLEIQEEDTAVANNRAKELLKIVGLEDKMHHSPSQPSGGQRQRVAIARSLAVNPEILLADEPTGALDSKTGSYILEFLNDLHNNQNKTIIIVTHDNELVKYAEKVIHIKDGMIEKIETKEKGVI
ncbi:MAG: ABC transporter ATP-binding protein, partial [Methanosarcinaceae archaeon]|nr:ABC transporter ATP-binding protein [Methanosarcinaceae archaeon]